MLAAVHLAQGLGEEAVQALLQATSGCQDELPFDAEPAAAAPAQRGRTKAGKKPAARKQAAQRLGARDHDSASSDEVWASVLLFPMPQRSRDFVRSVLAREFIYQGQLHARSCGR